MIPEHDVDGAGGDGLKEAADEQLKVALTCPA